MGRKSVPCFFQLPIASGFLLACGHSRPVCFCGHTASSSTDSCYSLVRMSVPAQRNQPDVGSAFSQDPQLQSHLLSQNIISTLGFWSSAVDIYREKREPLYYSLAWTVSDNLILPCCVTWVPLPETSASIREQEEELRFCSPFFSRVLSVRSMNPYSSIVPAHLGFHALFSSALASSTITLPVPSKYVLSTLCSTSQLIVSSGSCHVLG